MRFQKKFDRCIGRKKKRKKKAVCMVKLFSFATTSVVFLTVKKKRLNFTF